MKILKTEITLNILSIIGFCLTSIFIKTKYLTNLDNKISEQIFNTNFEYIDNWALIISEIGDKYVLTILIAILITILIFKHNKRLLLISTLSPLLSFLAVTGTKYLTGRSRPINAKVLEITSSFPSAHATMSTTIAILFAYILIEKFPKKKIIISFSALLFFILISLSRVILLVHHLSDVIGGVFLGFFIFSLVLIISRKLLPENKQYSK